MKRVLEMGKLTLFANFLKGMFFRRNVLQKKYSETPNILQSSIEENVF